MQCAKLLLDLRDLGLDLRREVSQVRLLLYFVRIQVGAHLPQLSVQRGELVLGPRVELLEVLGGVREVAVVRLDVADVVRHRHTQELHV